MTAPRFAAGPGFLRETCREICERAVLQGVCRAEAFWHLTPEELRLRIDAAREGEVRRLRLLDTLAWLAGQYVAVALNAPRRYPARPNRVRERATTDEGMRRVMEALALRGGGAAGEGGTQSAGMSTRGEDDRAEVVFARGDGAAARGKDDRAEVVFARGDGAAARGDAAREVVFARGDGAAARGDAAREVVSARGDGAVARGEDDRAEVVFARGDGAAARGDAAREVVFARDDGAVARGETTTARLDRDGGAREGAMG